MQNQNGKIAPHENAELQLIASGQKDFAVIEHAKNPQAYHDAAQIHRAGVFVLYEKGNEGDEVIIARHLDDIVTYRLLIRYGVAELGIKNYHRALGKLFGYSPEDIESFIDSDIHCDCSKCNGGK